MKRKHLMLAGALVLSAGLVIVDGAGSGEDSAIVEAAPRRAAAASASMGPSPRAGGSGSVRTVAPSTGEPSITRLIPRAELLGDGDEMGAEADLFRAPEWGTAAQAAASAAAKAAAAAPPEPPPPPPPPMAPPLPFVFIGKAREAGKWQVFLAQGDKTHVLGVGAVVNGTYRVENIAPPVLTLNYLPLNQTQQLNIGASD